MPPPPKKNIKKSWNNNFFITQKLQGIFFFKNLFNLIFKIENKSLNIDVRPGGLISIPVPSTSYFLTLLWVVLGKYFSIKLSTFSSIISGILIGQVMREVLNQYRYQQRQAATRLSTTIPQKSICKCSGNNIYNIWISLFFLKQIFVSMELEKLMPHVCIP